MTSYSHRKFHTIRVILFSSLLLFATISCTTTPRRPDIPLVMVNTTGELFSKTINANPVYDSLRGTARLSVSSIEEKYSVTELILAKKPGFLRLESIGPMGETILFLATDRKKVYIYSPMENRYYHGLASRKNLSLIIPLPFKSTDIVELLQGRIDLTQYYPTEMSFDLEKEVYTLTLMPDVSGRGRAYLKVDARTFYILEMKLYDTDNNLIIDGAFSHFEIISDSVFPMLISYRVPGPLSFVKIVIDYKEVKLNAFIEDSRFSIDAPRGVQEIDVDKSIINFDRTPIR